jgi:hypothetical protein
MDKKTIENDRKTLITILKGAGLIPYTAHIHTGAGLNGGNGYCLHYRKNQKDGNRFILNLTTPPSEALRTALMEAPIQTTLLIKG